MEKLEGRVAVVTGAASGMGRAFAERFAREGMKVVLADVDAGGLELVVDLLEKEHRDVLAVQTDVTEWSAVEALAREAVGAFGKVHVLCNNAGVTKHTGEAIWELTEEDWQWLLGVNLMGVVHGLRAFIPVLLAQNEEAHIVNTASLAGLSVGAGAYGAVKHAVVSLSESLLLDLRQRTDKIGVTCLCPGLVATGIVEAERARPAGLRNKTAPTPEQQAFKSRLAQMTQTYGLSPSQVADALVDAIRRRSFYLCTEDPPFFVGIDERVRQWADDFLARRDPAAVLMRR